MPRAGIWLVQDWFERVAWWLVHHRCSVNTSWANALCRGKGQHSLPGGERDPAQGQVHELCHFHLWSLNASLVLVGAILQYHKYRSDYSLFFIATVLVTALPAQILQEAPDCFPCVWWCLHPDLAVSTWDDLARLCQDSEAFHLGHSWTEMGWRPQVGHFQQELFSHWAVKILP